MIDLLKKLFRIKTDPKGGIAKSRHYKNLMTGPKVYLDGKPYVRVKFRFVDTLDFDTTKHLDQLETEIEFQNIETERLLRLNSNYEDKIKDLQTLNINLVSEIRSNTSKHDKEISKLSVARAKRNSYIVELEKNCRALNKSIEEFKNQIKQLKIDLDLPIYLKYEQSLDQENHLLDLISRISRLHEFYIRKFLTNLPINTRLEFIFLYTIDLLGDASKTEVINVHLVEFTTGMDIIKRLINQGLIKESLNKSDRRSKLIHTTEEGKAVLNNSMRQMDTEKEMFLACLNANKWKKIISTLEELNSFHNNIYLKHNSKNDAELINLVASLKYLNRTSY